jgi:cation diffusion facilitator family transporter
MSQRMTRSSRLSAAEREIAAAVADAAASDATKGSTSCLDRFMQTIRGERPIHHVTLVLKLSLLTNVLIVATMAGIAIASHSLALLSALAENLIDLFVQGLLAYAGTRSGSKLDYAKFPAGTSRFEPVAVIVASSIMVLVSVFFIQEGVTKIVDGVVHKNPEKPELSVPAVVIVSLAISTKVFLMLYSRWVLKSHSSVAVEAIQDDNRNDVLSNSFAIIAYIIASANEKLWYVDPAGAIAVFLFIMVAWARMGKEQVMQLVGVTASAEFIDEVKELCRSHNAKLSLDIVRAYHFGSKYLVELEVVVPADMTVKDAHDIALQLQFKVEKLEDVERAFVHVDYKARDYDEHIVSREEDALLMYAGYSGGETPASSVASKDTSYMAVSQIDVDAPIGATLETDEEMRMEIVISPTNEDGDASSHFKEMKQ